MFFIDLWARQKFSSSVPRASKLVWRPNCYSLPQTAWAANAAVRPPVAAPLAPLLALLYPSSFFTLLSLPPFCCLVAWLPACLAAYHPPWLPLRAPPGVVAVVDAATPRHAASTLHQRRRGWAGVGGRFMPGPKQRRMGDGNVDVDSGAATRVEAAF